MKLIQPAKFFAAPREGAIHAQAAHVRDGDLLLISKLPESAAEAERINTQVKLFIAEHNERARASA